VLRATSNQPSSAPGLNLSAALARLGGDRDLLRDLIEFFFEDSPPLLEQVDRGLSQRDASLVERSAHSLKGLAANFDAISAVQAALRLEKMGHAGDFARAPEAFSELQREIKGLREALSLYLATDSR
jgi:HPt (histidine-containing phosphotransfer) domain-containing protein